MQAIGVKKRFFPPDFPPFTYFPLFGNSPSGDLPYLGIFPFGEFPKGKIPSKREDPLKKEDPPKGKIPNRENPPKRDDADGYSCTYRQSIFPVWEDLPLLGIFPFWGIFPFGEFPKGKIPSKREDPLKKEDPPNRNNPPKNRKIPPKKGRTTLTKHCSWPQRRSQSHLGRQGMRASQEGKKQLFDAYHSKGEYSKFFMPGQKCWLVPVLAGLLLK